MMTDPDEQPTPETSIWNSLGDTDTDFPAPFFVSESAHNDGYSERCKRADDTKGESEDAKDGD